MLYYHEGRCLMTLLDRDMSKCEEYKVSRFPPLLPTCTQASRETWGQIHKVMVRLLQQGAHADRTQKNVSCRQISRKGNKEIWQDSTGFIWIYFNCEMQIDSLYKGATLSSLKSCWSVNDFRYRNIYFRNILIQTDNTWRAHKELAALKRFYHLNLKPAQVVVIVKYTT